MAPSKVTPRQLVHIGELPGTLQVLGHMVDPRINSSWRAVYMSQGLSNHFHTALIYETTATESSKSVIKQRKSLIKKKLYNIAKMTEIMNPHQPTLSAFHSQGYPPSNLSGDSTVHARKRLLTTQIERGYLSVDYELLSDLKLSFLLDVGRFRCMRAYLSRKHDHHLFSYMNPRIRAH